MKQGWEVKKLGEVCAILDNLRKPITKKDRIDGDYPYYGATGILSYVHNFIFDEKLVLIGEDGAKWASGDNTAFIVDGKYWVNNHAHVIRPNREIILDEWIVYFLNFSDLTKYITGMTVPKLNQEKMRSIEIPFPKSLLEQQRIVAILDEAFTAIERAKANAEQNLKNAKELFDSYLQSVFENRGEGWEEKPLQEIVDSKCTLSYGIVQPGDEFPDGLPIIRPTDLTAKFIDLVGLKLIDPKLADSYKRTTLIGDELLLCVRGNTGVISIATEQLKGANVTRGIVPIRFNPEFLKTAFGYYQFISDFIMKQIKGKTYGAALMQINIGELRKISMLIPPLSEQQTIVQKLDFLSAETKRLEAIYQQKIDNLEELKKSILQKAFNGEL